MTNALISAAELFEIIDRPDVRILDASYGLPEIPVKIGNAFAFDIDDVADPDAPLAHTLPSAEIFAEKAGAMGIANDDTVIVYDRVGMHMAAARAWWMFRVFGHDKVRILNGGLPAWVEQGLPLTPAGEETPEARKTAVFKASFRPQLFKKKEDILNNIQVQEFNIIDARDSARYTGAAPEPRPGMTGGHIPGSRSLPFASLIDGNTGLMRKGEELEQIIHQSGFDAGKPVAISCGSGVTACVVALALYQTGHPDAAIYGGSWAEWGSDAALPKNKGENP